MQDSTVFDTLTIDQIRNEIIRFKNDVFSQKLENYYGTRSLGEIFGVSRKELPHSNFIAWLLNNQESHNLGYYPFKKFLEILVLSCKGEQSIEHKKFFDSIITGDLKISDLSIVTEKHLPNIGRVDLVIEAEVMFFDTTKQLRVIVENKVTTKEHSDQTTKYYDYYEGLLESDVINLFVFLTPLSGIALSDLEEVECSCKEYIQTNYQNLVDYLLEPILNKDTSDKTRMIIKDYLQVLSQPTQNEDDDEHKQGLIMAIGNEERELLTRFWEQNQKLIMSALYAISSDPDQDKDVRDNISTALNSISGGEKDRSLISISYSDELYVENIRKSDIGYSSVMLLEQKNLIDEDVFKFLREDKSCSFLLLKLPEEFTETEVKYGKYRSKSEPELIFNGQGYYVARNWGIGNIQRFIDKLSTKFPGLQYQVG
jgi:hypothetical protein